MDDDVYSDFQRFLHAFNGSLERIETENNAYDAYSRQVMLGQIVKVKIIFDSIQSTEEFMQTIAVDHAETERRARILRKYPAALEAWEQYKTIEALCNDE